MADTRVFSPRPVTRKSAPLWKIVPSLRKDQASFDKAVEHTNGMYLRAVREEFDLRSWKWTPAAQFLYSCLVHALDLEQYESSIQAAAKSPRGRPKKTGVTECVRHFQEQGKNIPQIQAILKHAGYSLTRDAVRQYGKAFRKQARNSK